MKKAIMFRFLKNTTNRYKFQEPENTACITCNHVLLEKHPILLASHDEEGWQFLCGTEGHIEANAKVISLKSASEIDPSINDLYQMPEGFGAKRTSVIEKWQLFKLE